MEITPNARYLLYMGESLKRLLRKIIADTRGQDLIEYALMSGFAVTCAAVISPAFISANGLFNSVYTHILAVLQSSASTS